MARARNELPALCFSIGEDYSLGFAIRGIFSFPLLSHLFGLDGFVGAGGRAVLLGDAP